MVKIILLFMDQLFAYVRPQFIDLRTYVPSSLAYVRPQFIGLLEKTQCFRSRSMAILSRQQRLGEYAEDPRVCRSVPVFAHHLI